MQLQVKPQPKNAYPIGAVLIRSSSVKYWMEQIQQMGLNPALCKAYPVPGQTANSVWACLVVFQGADRPQAGSDQYCQVINDRLFIPENTGLYPKVDNQEIEKLLGKKPYFFHPETGLAELSDEIGWEELLELQVDEECSVVPPAEGVFIPGTIRRLEVIALPPDEALEHMEQQSFPKQEEFKDKPLSFAERIRLKLLRGLLNSNNADMGEAREPSGFMKFMDSIGRMLGLNKNNEWLDKLGRDYESLEQRSKDELQKLMDLFRSNPEEALKYAIPLDGTGVTRGGLTGSFEMQRRWNNFSLGQTSFGSGGSVMADGTFERVNTQYNKTAIELIKSGDHEKAAFIYLKLLKDPLRAAQALEDGGLYAEAAALYLKHTGNKHKAATCYEKGRMFTQALELYKELDEYEKVGDIHMLLSQREEAYRCYEKVAENYVQAGKYVKASLLYRNKMEDRLSAQALLREGWRLNRDAYNCLNNYFANIENEQQLQTEIDLIYLTETNNTNKETFLTVLRHEYEKHPLIRQRTREIAYEIVAEQSVTNPAIVASLQQFSDDKILIKDILRFKSSDKKR